MTDNGVGMTIQGLIEACRALAFIARIAGKERGRRIAEVEGGFSSSPTEGVKRAVPVADAAPLWIRLQLLPDVVQATFCQGSSTNNMTSLSLLALGSAPATVCGDGKITPCAGSA
jgi:hypothetical protein